MAMSSTNQLEEEGWDQYVKTAIKVKNWQRLFLDTALLLLILAATVKILCIQKQQ